MARVGCVAEGLHIGVSAREHGSDRPLADGTSASRDLYSQDLAKQHRSRGAEPPSREQWPTDVGGEV